MGSPAIECELRAFISPEQYEQLLARLKQEGEHGGEDEQVTYYFDGGRDLRIQQNSRYAKIWLKSGAIHDEAREEIEVRCPREEFGNLEKLFAALGYQTEIKWFRRRHHFKYRGLTVALDDTRGYGRIIELEKICAPEGREVALAELRTAMAGLGIGLTPKEEFDRKYQDYKKNWRDLTKQ